MSLDSDLSEYHVPPRRMLLHHPRHGAVLERLSADKLAEHNFLALPHPEEFYAEYSRLWRHVLDVRYRHRGKMRTYVALGAALATGKVSLGAVRKGMNIAKVFSKPETFLSAHQPVAGA